MLIIPELETVFILVPRTGTSTLISEVKRVYPNAMLPYRHMEADGVPPQYATYKKIGFVRHPVARLWSVFKMLGLSGHGDDSIGFEDWLRYNDAPIMPGRGTGADWAQKNRAPENKRSQYSYLRPDLGTEVRKYENLRDTMVEFGLDPSVISNASVPTVLPSLTDAAKGLIETYCAWDFAQDCLYV